MHSTLLVLGSYNGQDSFGDKCLLRSVVSQFRHVFGPDVRIVSYLHENVSEANAEFPDVEFGPGLSGIFWLWYTKLRHLHLPSSLHMAIAFCTFPFFLFATSENRKLASGVWRDASQSSLLYFYGGTQLSEQWFWLNFLPLMWTIIICRARGVAVYFGPQQYGPQRFGKRLLLRLTIKLFVRDVRVRNTDCLRLLNLPQEALTLDEVFSCTGLYGVVAGPHVRGKYLLVNMRGGAFLHDGTKKEFEAFAAFLESLHQRFRVPIKLFQMSGKSFSDDTLLIEFCKKRNPAFSELELIPYFEQEQEFIEIAKEAIGTVSMSFHGCVLTMIAGSPAVPVTLGPYYDYKYVDFDRYTGGQNVPIIDLSDFDPLSTVETIDTYFSNFKSSQVATTRVEAGRQLRTWYGSLAQHNAEAGLKHREASA
jgi:hypothetical protein